MAAFIAFLVAHQTFFATVGGLLIQEFIANATWIKANSIGQAVVGWVQAKLDSLKGQPAPKQ